MKRSQLEHALRAAADVLGENKFIVIGSQSILGWNSENELPVEASRSMEVDLVPFKDHSGEKADKLDGALGLGSRFHQTYGFYVDGASETTAKLPEGWFERTILFRTPNTGSAIAYILEPHDCAIAKLCAYRLKDIEWCESLVKVGKLQSNILRERLSKTKDMDPKKREQIKNWIDTHE